MQNVLVLLKMIYSIISRCFFLVFVTIYSSHFPFLFSCSCFPSSVCSYPPRIFIHYQYIKLFFGQSQARRVWPGRREEVEQTAESLLLELVMEQTHELLLAVNIERGQQRGEECGRDLVTSVQRHLAQVGQHRLLILSLPLLQKGKSNEELKQL